MGIINLIILRVTATELYLLVISHVKENQQKTVKQEKILQVF